MAKRWWRRRPAAGVAASLATGAVAMWVASALAPASRQPVDALAYLVSLPVALLLPAAALAAALIGWQAWRASMGTARAALALPALAAVTGNALAIGIFARVVAGLALR
ncbi:MAG: hypothetical protein ACREU7_14630 [Burkholderiales bacterium]